MAAVILNRSSLTAALQDCRRHAQRLPIQSAIKTESAGRFARASRPTWMKRFDQAVDRGDP
jgi:hypothetical protein